MIPNGSAAIHASGAYLNGQEAAKVALVLGSSAADIARRAARRLLETPAGPGDIERCHEAMVEAQELAAIAKRLAH